VTKPADSHHYRGGRQWVDLLDRARVLRRDTTDAEHLLWQLIRDRQIANVNFRRQHQFGPYILDFYCAHLKVVIEVDGSQHFSDVGKANDASRTAYLQRYGLTVLRFDNRQVLVETDAVLESILDAIEGDQDDPHPTPSPSGRGSRVSAGGAQWEDSTARSRW
jgi:very-short-patch-repair endonuclease